MTFVSFCTPGEMIQFDDCAFFSDGAVGWMKAARSLRFNVQEDTGGRSIIAGTSSSDSQSKGKTIADAVLSLDYENSNVACLIDQGCGVCMMARGIISTIPNIVNYLGIDVKDAEKDVEELSRSLPGVFATFKTARSASCETC